MIVSSANNIVDASVGYERGRSFMWIANKMGSNMEPWGTPEREVSSLDFVISMKVI